MECEKSWGGSREGAGRKKGGKNKSRKERVRVQVSFEPAEFERVKSLALAAGQTVNQFVRDAAVRAES